jgi:creatinine amidohydrolase/Fe(II)-dependent formamide hydrolase-like protein
MKLPKRDWTDMTWQDVAGAGADAARWIAVLPLAAVEQHGPHLPLGVDAFIAEAYLARVRHRLPDELPVTFLPARDLRARFGMLAVTVGWHRFGYPDDIFSSEEKRHGIHGGDIETSLMLAGTPEAVRMDKALNATPATVAMAREFVWLGAYRPAGFAWMTQDLHPTGAVGDATLASAAKGEAALNHGAEAFVELLCEIDRFDLKRLHEGPLPS